MKRNNSQKYWTIVFLGIVAIVAMVMAGCATTKIRHQEAYQIPAILKYPGTEVVTKEEPSDEEILAQEKAEERRLAKQPKITNMWEETGLRSVLHDIAIQAGVNIVIDIEVDGIVTLNVKDLPLERVLEMILYSRGYTFRKIEDYYVIGSGVPKTPMALALSETEQIVTNRSAEGVFSLLAPDLKDFVQVGNKTNRLSVTAPAKIMKRIKEDIILIDPSRDQVVIEALICEAKWDRRKTVGIDWSQILNFSAQGAIDYERDAPWGYAGVLSGSFESLIRLLAEKGDLDIKTKPKVVVMDGEKAVIDVTKETYVNLYEALPSADGRGFYYPTTRYEAKPIKTGVILTVTPRISRGGGNEIILNFEVEVSEIIDMRGKEENLPVVDKREVKSTVRVSSGETVVIGGLYQHLSQKKKAGIPILRFIPLLFGQSKERKQDTELIVFITPRNLKIPQPRPKD